MLNQLKNDKIRNEIKKRILAELLDKDLPLHRRMECESILYYISVFEKQKEKEVRKNDEK